MNKNNNDYMYMCSVYCQLILQSDRVSPCMLLSEPLAALTNGLDTLLPYIPSNSTGFVQCFGRRPNTVVFRAVLRKSWKLPMPHNSTLC